jgi:hypothetical protein
VALYRLLSYDITGTQFRGEIPFSSLTFGDVLNRPGSLDASIPARALEASRSYLEPGATTLWITRGEDLVWGGICWAWKRDLSENPEVRVAAAGPMSYYREGRRTIRSNATFTATDQMSIVASLFTTAHADTSNTTLPNPLGVSVNLYPSLSGTLRTLSYLGRDRKPIGETVEALSAMSDGFDINTRSSWNTSAIPPHPETSIEVWYPYQGSTTPIVWAHGHDVLLAPVEVDATKLASFIEAIGGDAGAGTVIGAASTAEGTYIEGTITVSDETDVGTLARFAEGELDRRLAPPVTTTAVLLDSDRWPIGSWNLGDQVWISAQDSGVSIEGYFRIIAWNCKIDQNGLDVIEVTLCEGLPLGRPILPPSLRLAQEDRDLVRRVERLEHS